LRTFFKLRCPVCGKGKIFSGYLDTPERCPECGFYFMRETGYFLPHSAISYLLVVFAAGVVWLVLHYGLRIESDALTLTSIIVLPVLFGVWSNRHAKMLWMAFDLWIHPPTREDFESRGRS
jgi:uncharacterized protein (DUF983 family)